MQKVEEEERMQKVEEDSVKKGKSNKVKQAKGKIHIASRPECRNTMQSWTHPTSKHPPLEWCGRHLGDPNSRRTHAKTERVESLAMGGPGRDAKPGT